MNKPSSPFARQLKERAQKLIQDLSQIGLNPELLPDSLRTYSIKITLEGAGRLNLYYSPKKNRFRLGGHELNDGELWLKITSQWDGDLGQAPGGDSSTKSNQKARVEPSKREKRAKSDYAAYVDGSHMKGRIGYGAVILKTDSMVWETCGSVPPEMSGMRQVGGELTAVMEVIRWCRERQVAAIAVHYDYEGIAAWPTGRWRAKLPATQSYQDFIRNCGVAVTWHKVKAHSGDYWNERADELARQGTRKTASGLAPKVDMKATPESESSQGAPQDPVDEDFADTPRFRFIDLHPALYCGTASNRYSGWLGQIYPRDKYGADLTSRSKTVAGRTYQEQVLPVKSVRDYFEHFRILEIDFTFYQSLLDAEGRPTRAHKVMESYLRYLGPEDRLLLKVPQTVSAPELFRGKSTVPNGAYLDAGKFTQGFYDPAVALCGEHLWGFVFEQGYVPKARRQQPRELAADFETFFEQAPQDSRYHLELRTTPYLAPPLFEVLSRHGVGQVLSHWTWLPDIKTQFAKSDHQFHNGAQQVVVRLITPRGMRYADTYHKAQPFNQLIPDMLDETMLDDTADLIKQALDRAYTLALIINNRSGGNAPLIAEALAMRLRAILGDEPSPPVND